MNNTNNIKGYKVFESDWTCRGFQYEVGKIFEEDVIPSVCDRGFHFCEKVSDCFNYYSFSPENKVAEVIALGDVDTDGTKSCTNKIQIVREISWEELLNIVNESKTCTGLCNTGDRNTGNYNTGDWNTGCCNTGDRNTGNRNTGNRNTGNNNTGNYNTGNWNTGDWNAGDRNIGNYNIGDWNIGNYNIGDWNIGCCNTGCFMTKESKIGMFDKPSDWSYGDWIDSDARYLLKQIPKVVVEWIHEGDMTDEEKETYPTYKMTGGYLKVLDESECGQIWWDDLTECQKDVIKALPNFDAEIFEKCTGIKIEHEEESDV